MDTKKLVAVAFTLVFSLFVISCQNDTPDNRYTVGMAYVVGESYVYRTFQNSSELNVNSTFDVTLDVVITGQDHFYAFEEYIPSAFTILSVDGANYSDTMSDPQVIKVVRFSDQALPNAQITYTLRANAEGTYIFDGLFQFETSTDGDARTLGERYAQVFIEPVVDIDPPSCGNGICEGVLKNENCQTCPADCVSGSGGTCSDCFKGTCDGSCNLRKETSSCSDCADSFCCGDGICEYQESVSTCQIDCACTTDNQCNDYEACTLDICSSMDCSHTWPDCGITDGCCSPGCSSASDADCQDCSDCFKGICDGVCHPRKDGPACPDCS